MNRATLYLKNELGVLSGRLLLLSPVYQASGKNPLSNYASATQNQHNLYDHELTSTLRICLLIVLLTGKLNFKVS